MPVAEATSTDFACQGFRHFVAGAVGHLAHFMRAIDAENPPVPGRRISTNTTLAKLLERDGPLSTILNELIAATGRPVRAVLFDKAPTANWTLGWHQDRTICVKKRRVTPGFENWSIKQGLFHVEPPFAFIERMITLRIHLDAVCENNAPLLISPGSHRLGKVQVGEIAQAVTDCGSKVCLADVADVWAYSTPILHASQRSRSKTRRRVLQIDYSSDPLPNGLEWLGI